MSDGRSQAAGLMSDGCWSRGFQRPRVHSSTSELKMFTTLYCARRRFECLREHVFIISLQSWKMFTTLYCSRTLLLEVRW